MQFQQLTHPSFGEGSGSWVWNYHIILHFHLISQIYSYISLVNNRCPCLLQHWFPKCPSLQSDCNTSDRMGRNHCCPLLWEQSCFYAFTLCSIACQAEEHTINTHTHTEVCWSCVLCLVLTYPLLRGLQWANRKLVQGQNSLFCIKEGKCCSFLPHDLPNASC